MFCGRNFRAASDPPARSPPISTVPPEVPLASIRADEVSMTSLPVTTTVPPAPPRPFAVTAPPTTTLLPLTTTSPPLYARRPFGRTGASGCMRRATTFCVTLTEPPSEVRKIRPPLLATPVALMARPVLPASA
jgi:hypothetical protein